MPIFVKPKKPSWKKVKTISTIIFNLEIIVHGLKLIKYFDYNKVIINKNTLKMEIKNEIGYI